MQIFRNEVFGPVLAVTTFKDEAEAIALANDTAYGLGAGVWTRDVNRQHRVGRALKSGRVWMNCYHHYPAGGCLCCCLCCGCVACSLTDAPVRFPQARHSAATRSPGSAARRIRPRCRHTNKPNAF